MTRRRRRLALALLLGALTVAGLAGHAALSAAEALERARAGLSTVDAGGSSVEDARAALSTAQDDLASAQADLDGWSVDIVAQVPVLGRSFRVERAVAQTAGHVVDGALVLADRLPAVQSRSGGVDLNRLRAVELDVARAAAGARGAFEELRRTETALTPAPVRDARRDALGVLGTAVDALETATDGMSLMGGLLGGSGDRSLLVMLQNNSELRGTGGYAATFATGRTSRGRLTLDPAQDVIDVADPPERARRVPAPPEFVHDYGPLSGDTTIWRSWNMSPHVPDAALVTARVAGAVLGREPDLVVLLDVPAMARLASLRGGVTLPDGSRASADQLSRALLVDAYQDAGADLQAQEARRSELQAAATSAFTDLLSSDLPIADAARALVELAGGRHLTVWSARPEEQALFDELDVAGAVAAPPGTDLAHVSVNNVGANKLDVYVDRSLSIDAVVGPSEAVVSQRVTFMNRAPANLVPYVAGEERPGTVISRVELSLPPAAAGISPSLDGGAWTGRIDAGAARHRLPVRVDTPRGATSTVEVRYRVPLTDGSYRLRVVPQPLANDAVVRVVVRGVDGRRLSGDQVQDGEVLVEGPLDRTLEVDARLADEQQG